MDEETKSEATPEPTPEVEVVETAVDEWDLWTRKIQNDVDSLISGKKMDRLAIFAIGGIGLCAIGASVALGRAVQGMMGAIQQLGENQAYLGKILGLDQAPSGPSTIDNPQVKAETNGTTPDLNAVRIQDAKTFDVPEGGEVAVTDGPASETSEAAKAQLKADKEAGIIDEFKGAEPDAGS